MVQDGGAFPVIGIGASAGGLAAFEQFFSGVLVGAEPNAAFLLVQHLAPDHSSLLSDLLGKHTHLQVHEAEDGMVVRPSCVYVIPPNYELTFRAGALHLQPRAEPRGRWHPIDTLFQSLAEALGAKSVGVILSGTGTDGTVGARAIKAEGGAVMVQAPESAEFDGMPQSALATGLVDYVLAPAEMPDALANHVARDSGAPPRTPADDVALRGIFASLRGAIGHDFSEYKRATILRRIDRRMAVHKLSQLADYDRHLREHPMESAALFSDLLIGVTSFFRDQEAFAALESQVIPRIFADKAPTEPIRVWVPACSTGEEAYSLAILLHERMLALNTPRTVRIFATDIDSHAIRTARAGVYPASIADDVGPERVARYFVPEPETTAYRVQKVIRDLVVFSEQNILDDPPFSKLDLLSCRNLLIYLSSEPQARLFTRFHYALLPGGFLFLGSSEALGEAEDGFAAVDRTAKIFRRGLADRSVARALTFAPRHDGPTALVPHVQSRSARLLTERGLAEAFGAAGVLVSARGDIRYLHGRTGLYLEPTPGDPALNALKMARDGLRFPLTVALRQAALAHEVVHHRGVRVKTNGDYATIDLSVRPVQADPPTYEPELYLIVLEPAAERVPLQAAPGADDSLIDARLEALTADLHEKEAGLQVTTAALEAANEVLQSSNEEFQSVNEELQSANEELQTSKEEMQSVNEELSVVNAELNTKVADLTRANNDVANLLVGTDIGTIFLDQHLNIRRYTPAVTRVVPLIPTDIGRPLAQIASQLQGFDRLADEVHAVLDDLAPRESEVQTRAGAWYLLRVRPYRTIHNVIDGVVITLTETTAMRAARDALAETEAARRLAAVVLDARDAITLQAPDGTILAWNPAAERAYGWSEAETLGKNIRMVIPEAQRAEALVRQHALAQSGVLAPYAAERITKDGGIVRVWMTAVALQKAGTTYAIATTERPAQDVS